MIELRNAESYTGEQIHCARWDRCRDLSGQRVAVIGEGAAVARVLPGVITRAEHVTVFLDDPIWVLPRPPMPYPRWVDGLARRVPDYGVRLAARMNLRFQVRDPWVRRQLTPESSAEVHLHNHFYGSLQRDNCKLITWPIARLAPLGVRTVDGIEHRVDCIVFAEDSARVRRGVA
ncbi:hypothetical protein ACFQZZ_29860 [Nocardia sp. GCM10030253]|uniref:hypothetical protein n=1 Tax=Nocardia sp. GCM10030253 TaxID=3273404 RepID=UPI003636B598